MSNPSLANKPHYRILFAGTPEFAAIALRALIDSEHTICAVYTQPDRPAGRGRKLTASPVKQLAEAHNLPVHQPTTLKDETALRTLLDYQADVMVVVAYGMILPASVLRAPRYGCLNIHASLLPRWRGAAPIQRAILAGDQETGITIMRMDEGLDTGPMLLKTSTTISPDDTAESLHDRLAKLGAQAILEALAQLQELADIPQEEQACYATKLSKQEANIDWSQSATQLDRQVRAFNPWPVAQTTLNSQTLRIWTAQALAEEGIAEPGTVVACSKQGIDITCGEGVLRLTKLQPPGGKPMDVAAFLNGHADLLVPGVRLNSSGPTPT